LLARGYDSTTFYNIRHTSSDVLSFVTTRSDAGLSVVDSARFRKFAPSDEPIEEAAK
jgi:hypothetical protein